MYLGEAVRDGASQATVQAELKCGRTQVAVKSGVVRSGDGARGLLSALRHVP